jgi:hypothetical protein
MALDLSGFVMPEQKYEWIGKIGENIEANRLAKQKAAKEQLVRREAGLKYFGDYINNYVAEIATGTSFDVIVHKGRQEALNQAETLIAQGVDIPTVSTIISPTIRKISDYASKAKILNKNISDGLEPYKNTKGIDAKKLKENALKFALGESGEHIDDLDPSQNFVQLAIEQSDVFNTETYNEYAHDDKLKDMYSGKKYTKSSTGKVDSRDASIKKASYLVPELDNNKVAVGFVPKYQIATDEGKPLIAKFYTEQGAQDHPIRLFDENIFESWKNTPSQFPMYGYAMQEARKYATKEGIPMTDPKVKMLARAIAYDELNVDTRKPLEEKTSETLIQPQIKLVTGGGSSANKPTEAEKKLQTFGSNLAASLNKRGANSSGEYSVSDIVGNIEMFSPNGVKIKKAAVTFNPTKGTFTYTPVNKSIPAFTISVEEAAAATNSSDVYKIQAFKNFKSTTSSTKKKGKNSKNSRILGINVGGLN